MMSSYSTLPCTPLLQLNVRQGLLYCSIFVVFAYSSLLFAWYEEGSNYAYVQPHF